MTARVTVKSHALAVLVESADLGEGVRVEPHTARTFDVDGSGQFTVTEQEEQPQEDIDRPLDSRKVPGRAQNDALLSKPAPTVKAAD